MHRSLRQAGLSLLLTLLVIACAPAGAYAAGHPPGDDTLAQDGLSGAAKPDQAAKPSRPAVGYEYTVRPGDTFWAIAAAHGLAVETLLAANKATGKELLQPGQKLFVPAKPAAVPPPKAPLPAPPAPAPGPSKAAAGAPPPKPAAPPKPTVPPPAPTAQPAAPAPPGPTPPPPAPTAQPAAAAPPEPAAPPPAPTAQPAPAAPQQPEWADALLKLINARRVAAGLYELTWSPELAAAAQAHAEDCARRSRGSHLGSDGAALWARLARAGYQAAASSENWANTQGPQATFGMWWNEPPATGPHRRNILDPRWRELGVGIARGSWGWYFVADFGAR